MATLVLVRHGQASYVQADYDKLTTDDSTMNLSPRCGPCAPVPMF